MKRVILPLLACFCLLMEASADSKHHLSVGYGILTHSEMKEIFSEVFEIDKTIPTELPYVGKSNDLQTTTGCIGLSYDRSFGKHVYLGVFFGFEQLNIDQTRYVCKEYKLGEPNWLTYDGKLQRQVFLVMPHLKLYWFNKRIVGMYSKLSFGAHFDKDSYKDEITEEETKESKFACQISPVCIELGLRRLKGFFEAGYGMQGVGMLGIKYSLP